MEDSYDPLPCGQYPIMPALLIADEKVIESINLDVYGRMLAEAILEERSDHLVEGGSNRPGSSDKNKVVLRIMGQVDKTRVRIIRMMEDSPEDIGELVEAFKKDPMAVHKRLRENILKLANDPVLTDDQRERYLDGFVDAYLNLILELDHLAFPARGTKRGTPSYLPDMFTDKGNDHRDSGRKWDKPCITKTDIFEDDKDLIKRILTVDMDENDIVKVLAMAINSHYQYSFDTNAINDFNLPPEFRSLFLSTMAVRLRRKLGHGVCRHFALEFQALAQTVGLESRLVPCFYDDGNHYANIVKINGIWHFFDITNPDGKKIFLRELAPDFEPNKLSTQSYTFRFGDKKHPNQYRTYRTYNDTMYEIKPHDYTPKGDDLSPTDITNIQKSIDRGNNNKKS